MSPPSVLSSWTRVIIDALLALGRDPEPVLSECGFASDVLRDPSARLDAHATAQLWRAAASYAHLESFGLYASTFVRPTTFHALGYAFNASATLREALMRLVHYSRVVTDVGALDLQCEQEPAALVIVTQSADAPSFEARDAILSLIVRTCRRLSGDAFALQRVQLRRPPPRDVLEYEQFYSCAVAFSSERDALIFSGQMLDPRLEAGDSELASHNDELLLKQLSRIRGGSVVERVRHAVAEQLAFHVTPDVVASKLGMSSRSLQRYLQEEGTSYAKILRATRRELAEGYLRDPRRSIIEITLLLGFEDASAFARAFRSWTGCSPTEFRDSRR